MNPLHLSKQLLGKTGEDIAVEYLQKHGFRIIERNFKARYGELDIITVKNNALIVVEVKTRTNTNYGRPEESITKRKLHELIITTQYYALLHPDFPKELHIDLLAIDYDKDTDKYTLQHITDISS